MYRVVNMYVLLQDDWVLNARSFIQFHIIYCFGQNLTKLGLGHKLANSMLDCLWYASKFQGDDVQCANFKKILQSYCPMNNQLAIFWLSFTTFCCPYQGDFGLQMVVYLHRQYFGSDVLFVCLFVVYLFIYFFFGSPARSNGQRYFAEIRTLQG